jgi:2-hydroxychromene-2-carboxylate isomerase
MLRAMAVLYIDVASPYAYLAAERAPAVLGEAPRLEPVVLGAIFALRGHGSWAHTDQREPQMREVERRAAAYGLPPVVWPAGWPANSLRASRAIVWAERHGAGHDLALALFRAGFARGEDIANPAVVRSVVASLGLPAEEMEAAIADPVLKQELKDRTAAAWAAGVRGVPTLREGDRLFYGDDRLEEAAA